jgi:hypothetical protein
VHAAEGEHTRKRQLSAECRVLNQAVQKAQMPWARLNVALLGDWRTLAAGAPLQPEHPCREKGRWRRGANGGAAAVAADLPAFLSSPLLQMLQGLLLFRLCLPSTSPLQLGAGIHVCWCCALASASAGVHACLCKGMRACSWSTVQCCHVHVVHACLLVLQRACCACLHNSPSVDTSSRMRTS